MEVIVIGFAFGVLACQFQSSLSDVGAWTMLLAVACTLGLPVCKGWRRAACVLVISALLGFAQANWRAEVRLADRLSKALERQDIPLVGVISDLPQAFDRGLRFTFKPDAPPPGVPHEIQLSWYFSGKPASAPAELPRAGETWRLLVRLRQPHGNLNPHGFDYEAWAFERGIGAVGYVRPKGDNQRLSAGARSLWGWVDQQRQRIRERFERALPDSPWRGVLVALSVGDQGAISRAQWTLFSQTGVTHLMSISGLHVTMLGALAGALLSAVWRRIGWLALRVPAQKAAVVAATMAAGLYVLLAGCGVPAQRTFYMLTVAALGLWLGRGALPRRVLLAALFVVLVVDPWAVLSAGFWLSFIAVAALLLIAAAGDAPARWREWWRAQWAVTVLSLPILLGLFQQFSLISPLANALAIPVISFLITPLALLFAAFPFPSLAELANLLLGGLMWALDALAALPFALWQQAAPPGWLVVAASLGVAWSLMPRGVPARFAGLLCLLPLLAWSPPRPAPGEAELTVLDVGQGLATHVRTARHDLVFDAGPDYGPELDAGMRVVLPYLRAEGVRALDMLVVSHDDIDHAGGADSVLAGLPVVAMRSSLPAGHALLAALPQAAPCHRGQSWEWDGVRFEFLHPPADWHAKGDNDSSCVLRVTTPGASVLLTGDIEWAAEQSLLTEAATQLAAQILVVPHHGSRSTSHAEFVAAVGAREAVFSSGYLNRFQHPHPDVLIRYQQAAANTWRTDESGALRYRLLHEGYAGPTAERAQRARYWHDR